MARKEFTKKQVKEYLADTSKCPNCGEATVKVVEDFTEDSLSRTVECENCPTKFHEVYTLTSIEKIN